MTQIETKIQSMLIAAMKSKDEVTTLALRQAKAAIQNKKTEGTAHELSEQEATEVISKLVKQLADSEKIYREANRLDLAEEDSNRRKIFESLLPKQLEESQIRDIVQTFIEKLKLERNMKNMGRLINEVKAEYGTQASASLIAKVVKEELTKLN